ncbi:MAG: ATP-dependent DNA ligase [Candidatus Bathyarchaeota archaeon]|nr:ATP-dependent DNA ligase [Candidatus Bathyarchaeota archaeon]
MTLVKPPSFNQLVKLYGSSRKAVLHLLESGNSPDEISWKMNVPYYLIRLYMNGNEVFKERLFYDITKVYDRLTVVRGKGKETELVSFIKRGDLDLETKVRLVLGRIVDESLGIGPGLVERSMSTVAGVSSKAVKRLLGNYGEHGEVAFLLLSRRSVKEPRLTLEEVYESIKLLPKLEKVTERDQLVASLLEASTPQEAKYIVRLLLFDLKLGFKEKTVIHAAARVYSLPSELIESVCGIIGLTEGILLAQKGALALSKVKLRPGQFLKPQLAELYQPEKVTYPTLAEHKLDGSRLQIHKWGSRIRLYSRRGVEKSKTLPEIMDLAREFKAQSTIVDGEVLAINAQGKILPFQSLLRRTAKTKLPEEEMSQSEVKVTIRVFDILFLNGRELAALPLSQRRKFLVNVIPRGYLVESEECQNEVELMSFYEKALEQGYEGIVVKNLDSTFEFGQRSNGWLKLKPERDTIDITLIKALHGKGRRAGLYSSFLMAIRHQTEKKLYTIGKVSNLSENTMEELKQIAESTITNIDDEGIFIKPSVVLEVTFQEIQISKDYTSGYALRVPKVVRFRPDKNIDEIDYLDKIQNLYELQYDRKIPQTI